MEGSAKVILPALNTYYDLIFFDGFAPEYVFLEHFEKLMQFGGSDNANLRGSCGSTKNEYWQGLNNNTKWEVVNEFGDTKVHKRR